MIPDDDMQIADPHHTKSHTPKKRRKVLGLLTFIFLLILLLYFVYWLFWARFRVYTDDAYVNGNIVALMPQITGTVTEILADDTMLVSIGQPIIKLDRADYLLALENAKANLAATVRRVRQSFEEAQSAKYQMMLQRADFVRASLDLKRRVGLVDSRALSKEELQHAQTGVKTAEAAYDAAFHRFSAAFALVENAHVYTHPFVNQAKTALKNAYLNLERTTVLAPVTGYVAKRNVNVGQAVSPSAPMLAIIPESQIWVDANYKESQLYGIRIGQPVEIFADALPNVRYHGKIYGLNMGTGAVFSILPPQNATGNWIKIVQRVAVRIALDPEEIRKNPLQLGLSMHVTTDIHDQSGPRLAERSQQKPIYTTDIYAKQLAHVDALIEQILQDNSPNLYLPRYSQEKVSNVK